MAADMPFEHEYARETKQEMKKERGPSFMMHSYAKSQLTPPKSKTSKRCRGTPSGETPIQPAKLQCQSVGSKWESTEIEFLKTFLECNPPLMPISNEYWRSLASSLNDTFGTSRTGVSCRCFYARLLKSTRDTSADVQSKNMTVDQSCQTDLSIPPLQSRQSVSSQHERLEGDSLDPPDSQKMLHYLRSARNNKSDQEQKQFFFENDNLETHLVLDIIKKICTGSSSIDIAKQIMNIKCLKESLWSLFMLEIEASAKYMACKKQSYLGRVTYDDLRCFTWENIIEEMFLYQPRLLQILITISTGENKVTDDCHYMSAAREIGLIYGILMKRRSHILSRVQRMIAIAIAQENVHQKVYDRLQTLGVTVSHATLNKVQDQIGGHFNQELIQAVLDGKRFRIVGDNVNFMVTASHQRKGNSTHMEHWFASAAIIQNNIFDHLPSDLPQLPLLDLPPQSFLPDENDFKVISNDYIYIIFQILMRHMKFFKQFKQLTPELKNDLRATDCDMKSKNVVVTFPVLFKNEQSYAEVVDIMDSYEDHITEVYGKSNTDLDGVKVHIGGDQLTRERFSGAKRVRQQAMTEKERFVHLSPVTFEFFHLQMAFLTTFFKTLYNDNCTEPGTLYAEKIKLGRSHANGEDVKNHYEQCKELGSSVISSHVVVAALQYFNMKDVDEEPATLKDLLDSEQGDAEKKQIICDVIGNFVQKYIFKDSLQIIQNSTRNTVTNMCGN